MYTQIAIIRRTKPKPAKKLIKEGVTNLNWKELEENKIRVLNFDQKFVPTYNRRQHTWTLFRQQKLVR